MGKQKRQRLKLHSPAVGSKQMEMETVSDTAPLLPLTPTENVFDGIKIDLSHLSKIPNDDVQSIKSYKSTKSEKSQILPKKDKLELRREILLKKIDAVNQMKKELKLRNKRKSTSIIGDTNPLHDALPSLESLLKKKTDDVSKTNNEPKKKKGIEKLSKRQKNLIQGVKVFKQVFKNKKFQKNPFEAISEHIKNVVEETKTLIKK